MKNEELKILRIKDIGIQFIGEIIMAKKKNMLDLMNEIRRSWVINPRTRVKENELKNKKKRRQEDKKKISGSED